MRTLEIEQRADGTWAARAEDLPGFVGYGKTRDEAIQRVTDALKLYDPCRCER